METSGTRGGLVDERKEVVYVNTEKREQVREGRRIQPKGGTGRLLEDT